MTRIGFLLALAALFLQPISAAACTMPVASAPEIEIEVEFEDYDDVRNRVIYKVEVEAEIMAPTTPSVCQCGLGFGSPQVAAPASFNVLNAVVGVAREDGDGFDLEAFDGFEGDDEVTSLISTLGGFAPGATAFGFSADVQPFDVPALQPNDAYVLAFLIEFAPEDFSQVNGNRIQFAAGSNEISHPVNIFQRYQPTLRLPPFQLDGCDFNLDQSCDVTDVNAFYALGPIDQGFERTDATEQFDLNGDDFISLGDLQQWLKQAARVNGLASPYVYGDADLDGRFDSSDLVQVFQAGQFETGVRGQNWSTGDWNGNGLFESGDLVVAFQTAAYERDLGAEIAPEPTSRVLLLSLLLSTFVLPKRKSFKGTTL